MDESVQKIDDLEKIAFLLHHIVFSYEQAYEKLIGTASRAILQELVKGLEWTFETGDFGKISKSNSLHENVSAFIDQLNSSGYFENIRLEYMSNSYLLEIQKCIFTQKYPHSSNLKKHVCPFAILAAAVIHYSNGGLLRINETDFNEDGSRTVIENVGWD